MNLSTVRSLTNIQPIPSSQSLPQSTPIQESNQPTPLNQPFPSPGIIAPPTFSEIVGRRSIGRHDEDSLTIQYDIIPQHINYETEPQLKAFQSKHGDTGCQLPDKNNMVCPAPRHGINESHGQYQYNDSQQQNLNQQPQHQFKSLMSTVGMQTDRYVTKTPPERLSGHIEGSAPYQYNTEEVRESCDTSEKNASMTVPQVAIVDVSCENYDDKTSLQNNIPVSSIKKPFIPKERSFFETSSGDLTTNRATIWPNKVTQQEIVINESNPSVVPNKSSSTLSFRSSEEQSSIMPRSSHIDTDDQDTFKNSDMHVNMLTNGTTNTVKKYRKAAANKEGRQNSFDSDDNDENGDEIGEEKYELNKVTAFSQQNGMMTAAIVYNQDGDHIGRESHNGPADSIATVYPRTSEESGQNSLRQSNERHSIPNVLPQASSSNFAQIDNQILMNRGVHDNTEYQHQQEGAVQMNQDQNVIVIGPSASTRNTTALISSKHEEYTNNNNIPVVTISMFEDLCSLVLEQRQHAIELENHITELYEMLSTHAEHIDEHLHVLYSNPWYHFNQELVTEQFNQDYGGGENDPNNDHNEHYAGDGGDSGDDGGGGENDSNVQQEKVKNQQPQLDNTSCTNQHQSHDMSSGSTPLKQHVAQKISEHASFSEQMGVLVPRRAAPDPILGSYNTMQQPELVKATKERQEATQQSQHAISPSCAVYTYQQENKQQFSSNGQTKKHSPQQSSKNRVEQSQSRDKSWLTQHYKAPFVKSSSNHRFQSPMSPSQTSHADMLTPSTARFDLRSVSKSSWAATLPPSAQHVNIAAFMRRRGSLGLSFENIPQSVSHAAAAAAAAAAVAVPMPDANARGIEPSTRSGTTQKSMPDQVEINTRNSMHNFMLGSNTSKVRHNDSIQDKSTQRFTGLPPPSVQHTNRSRTMATSKINMNSIDGEYHVCISNDKNQHDDNHQDHNSINLLLSSSRLREQFAHYKHLTPQERLRRGDESASNIGTKIQDTRTKRRNSTVDVPIHTQERAQSRYYKQHDSEDSVTPSHGTNHHHNKNGVRQDTTTSTNEQGDTTDMFNGVRKYDDNDDNDDRPQNKQRRSMKKVKNDQSSNQSVHLNEHWGKLRESDITSDISHHHGDFSRNENIQTELDSKKNFHESRIPEYDNEKIEPYDQTNTNESENDGLDEPVSIIRRNDKATIQHSCDQVEQLTAERLDNNMGHDWAYGSAEPFLLSIRHQETLLDSRSVLLLAMKTAHFDAQDHQHIDNQHEHKDHERCYNDNTQPPSCPRRPSVEKGSASQERKNKGGARDKSVIGQSNIMSHCDGAKPFRRMSGYPDSDTPHNSEEASLDSSIYPSIASYQPPIHAWNTCSDEKMDGTDNNQWNLNKKKADNKKMPAPMGPANDHNNNNGDGVVSTNEHIDPNTVVTATKAASIPTFHKRIGHDRLAVGSNGISSPIVTDDDVRRDSSSSNGFQHLQHKSLQKVLRPKHHNNSGNKLRPATAALIFGQNRFHNNQDDDFDIIDVEEQQKQHQQHPNNGHNNEEETNVERSPHTKTEIDSPQSDMIDKAVAFHNPVQELTPYSYHSADQVVSQRTKQNGLQHSKSDRGLNKKEQMGNSPVAEKQWGAPSSSDDGVLFDEHNETTSTTANEMKHSRNRASTMTGEYSDANTPVFAMNSITRWPYTHQSRTFWQLEGLMMRRSDCDNQGRCDDNADNLHSSVQSDRHDNDFDNEYDFHHHHHDDQGDELDRNTITPAAGSVSMHGKSVETSTSIDMSVLRQQMQQLQQPREHYASRPIRLRTHEEVPNEESNVNDDNNTLHVYGQYNHDNHRDDALETENMLDQNPQIQRNDQYNNELDENNDNNNDSDNCTDYDITPNHGLAGCRLQGTNVGTTRQNNVSNTQQASPSSVNVNENSPVTRYRVSFTETPTTIHQDCKTEKRSTLSAEQKSSNANGEESKSSISSMKITAKKHSANSVHSEQQTNASIKSSENAAPHTTSSTRTTTEGKKAKINSSLLSFVRKIFTTSRKNDQQAAATNQRTDEVIGQAYNSSKSVSTTEPNTLHSGARGQYGLVPQINDEFSLQYRPEQANGKFRPANHRKKAAQRQKLSNCNADQTKGKKKEIYLSDYDKMKIQQRLQKHALERMTAPTSLSKIPWLYSVRHQVGSSAQKITKNGDMASQGKL